MFISALRTRTATNGAQPLLTYYDGAADTRTELSGATFSNWVDKTANLIADLGHEDGEPIDVLLASTQMGRSVTVNMDEAAVRQVAHAIREALS